MKHTASLSRTFLLTGVILPFLMLGCLAPQQKATQRALPADAGSTTNLKATQSLDAGLLQLPTEAFTLGPGDRLDVEFIGESATRTTVEVGPDGKIYFYLLPGLDVWGLTLPQAKDLIAEKSQLYMKKKQEVGITLRSVGSKRVWLLGRLHSPGVYPMTGPMTLLEAIAEAGGPMPQLTDMQSLAAQGGAARNDAADLRRSFVLRHGQLLPVNFSKLLDEGDLSQNIYLQADDFVYLPSAASQAVHVLGAVLSPKSVSFSEQLSLVQTIANAGGTIENAYLTHVAIVRGGMTEPSIIIVDYKAVLNGSAPDVRLEPQDIVYVPYTPYRTLVRYADLILQTFARTIGVNEGARLVSPNSVPVGVNVPLGR